jgi:hypothetical protein
MPRVGDRARIAHFGGGFEQAVITIVTDEGRRVQVRVEGGRLHEFQLSPATARFVSPSAGGPRLELLEGR